MAYFSNGTEGMMYEEQYCDRCIHQNNDGGGCAIWFVHLIHNSDQHSNKEVKSILDQLIPREGITNQQCSMFAEEVPCQTP